MNRVEKLIKSSFFALLLQVVTLITGLIIPRIMLSTYGSEVNGLVSSITQFIAYFNIVEAGLASASIYALYKPLSYNNKNEINGILSATNKFYKNSGYIFVSLTIAFSVIYPVFIQSRNMSYIELSLLILVLSTSGTLEFFTLAKYRALLTADQKQYILSIASIVSILINVVIVIVCAELKVTILFLRFICLFSVFARSIILCIYVKINYKYINYKAKPNSDALSSRYAVLTNEIFGSIHNSSPILIITFMLSLELVSVYTVFSLVINGINSLISFFVTALSALLGEVLAKKEWDVLEKTYNTFEFTYYAILSVITICTMELIMPFIKIYTMGVQDISYDRPIFALLCVLMGMSSNIYTPQSILVRAGGKFKETRIQTIIQGVLTLILGVILTEKIGLLGVCLASIISNIYRSTILILNTQSSILPKSKKITFKRIFRMLVCIIIFNACITNNSVISLFKYNIKNYIDWLFYAVFIGICSLTFVGAINTLMERKTISDIIINLKKNYFSRKIEENI